MPKFKVRRALLANGGLEVQNSASLVGGGAVGACGSEITQIKFGTVTGSVDTIAAGSGVAAVAGSLLIAGLNVDAKIFLTPINACGVIVTTASVTAASVVSASYADVTHVGTGAACDYTFHYLAFV